MVPGSYNIHMWPVAGRLTIALQLGVVLANDARPLLAQAADTGAPLADALAEPARRVRRLFRDEAPLVVTIGADLRTVFAYRDTVNPPRNPGTLTFPGDSGPVVIPIELATRGHFRLKPSTCGFPPLKVYLPKEHLKGTSFAGNPSLKLITHCDKSSRYEQNLLVEYAIYRAYNRLTELSYRARLAHITYADSRDSSRNLTRYGFFLEDDKDMAERNGAQLFEQFGSYSEMDSTQMDLVAVFQYLIGNTDWSVIMRHNIRLMQIPGRNVLYPVPYDFDFAGVVDASYARPDPRMPIRSVRERLYRGMCRSREEIAPTLGRMAAAKEAIEQAFTGLPELDPKRLKQTLAYLDEGFRTIAVPKDFMPEQEYVCAKTAR
jgi:hypothetical protein